MAKRRVYCGGVNLFRSGVYPEITGYTTMGVKLTNHTSDFTLTFSECEV